METSASKEEEQSINVLAIKTEADEDLECLNINPGTWDDNVNAKIKHEISEGCDKDKESSPRITSNDQEIVVRNECEPLVNIFIKTEESWDPKRKPNEVVYTECEDVNSDIKCHKLECSTSVESSFIGEDHPRFSCSKRMKTYSKGQMKSSTSLFIENKEDIVNSEFKNKHRFSAQKNHNTPQCPHCLKPFSNKYTLKVHINSKHKNIKYECSNCHKKFSYIVNLKNHIKTVHEGIKGNKIQKYLKCNECNKWFSQAGNLKVHINSVHRKIQDFVCEVCGSMFSRLKNLKLHLDIHDGIKNYQCMECFKKFSELGKLKIHVDAVHRKLRNYECMECEKRFSIASNLYNHVRTVHRRNKKFVCFQCDKVFTSSGNLKRHINSLHEGIENFTCAECNRKFFEFKNLKHHINALHARIGNYQCKGCNKRFSWLRQFKRHISSVCKEDNYDKISLISSDTL